MTVLGVVTACLLGSGAVFFFSGTVGLLRFPDTLSRLHALTKADNLGLGLLVAGLALQADSISIAAKLILIWLLTLLASANSAYLIAGATASQLGPVTSRHPDAHAQRKGDGAAD